jgi:sugar lactone lactonase YvrE
MSARGRLSAIALFVGACALLVACKSTGTAYNPPGGSNNSGGGSTVEIVAWDEFAATPDPQGEYTTLPLTSSSSVTDVYSNATNMLDFSFNALVDSKHRLWVMSYPPGNGPETAEIFTSPTSTPISITFPDSGCFCGGIAFDASGNLWAMEIGGGLYEFKGPFNSSETLPQSAAAVHIDVPVSQSDGIAIDSAGDVFFSNSGQNEGTDNIGVYVAPVTSASTIDHWLGGMAAPSALIFDSQGNLYAGGYQGSTCTTDCDFGIARYNANNLGPNATPNIVDDTGMAAVDANSYASEFAIDKEGNLYDADCGDTGAIFVYPSVATQFSSTEAPSVVFQDSTLTSVRCAWGIAIDEVPKSELGALAKRVRQQLPSPGLAGRAARAAILKRLPLPPH